MSQMYFFNVFILKKKTKNEEAFQSSIQQWSPVFLAPGTGFIGDNFSVDRGGGGMVQVILS